MIHFFKARENKQTTLESVPNLPDVTGPGPGIDPGIDPLTQDVIASSLLGGSVLTFETSSEIGPLVDIFDISSCLLYTSDAADE